MTYDVTIIGGGPGGYVCAIKAAQLGLKVALVEERKTLGGTCLNVGCIPSKALLNASEKYYEGTHHFADLGIKAKGISVDLAKMMKMKEGVVKDLTTGIDFLMKKNKVDCFVGKGTIVSSKTVSIHNGKDTQEISSNSIVIATGSKSSNIPGVNVDEKGVVSSTGALSLQSVPKKMVVIGGGYIGLEMGSVWQRLGSKVTVIEYASNIIPMMDQDLSSELLKSLKSQGMSFLFSKKVKEVKKTKAGHTIVIENASGEGREEKITADVVLVSVGRFPNTENLGLGSLGVSCDEKGYIQVDEAFKTSVDGIYALGDVIGGAMLAHKAEEEGVAVAEILAGKKAHVNYNTIPGVIYTMPEVASVGATEQELKEKRIPYNVGKFLFKANSRAKANLQTEGFVKVLSHKETDEILGTHIIGADAGTLIGELVVGMEFKAAAEDIGIICHAHPTTSEALKEAALAAFDKPIHS